MCRIRSAIAVLCWSIVLLSGCAYSPRPAPQINVQAQVRWLTPGLEVTFEECSGKPPLPYSVHCFSYGQSPEWPYGQGLAVASARSGAVLWIYLHPGDYAPHEIHWADFDGDGRYDIYFLAGEEDEFTTSVYLNRIVADRFGVSHFVTGYYNPDVYAVVVDFAADGVADLIVPEPYVEPADVCADELREFERRDHESRDVYVRLAGRFDSLNPRFGREEEEVPGFALFDRIEVVRLGKTFSPEPVREHLRWRVAKLRDSLTKVSPGCHDRVIQTIEHLERLLER